MSNEIDCEPFESRTQERSAARIGVPTDYRRKTLATIDLANALTEFLKGRNLGEQFKTWKRERMERFLKFADQERLLEEADDL